MAIRVRPQSKYRAVPTVIDNIRFASKKEAKRYGELKLLEKAGEIRGLRCQVRYSLDVYSALTHGEQRIGHYVADFQYQERDPGDRDEWRLVTEDVKGMRTAMYRWKARHMKAQYGIDIREV